MTISAVAAPHKGCPENTQAEPAISEWDESGPDTGPLCHDLSDTSPFDESTPPEVEAWIAAAKIYNEEQRVQRQKAPIKGEAQRFVSPTLVMQNKISLADGMPPKVRTTAILKNSLLALPSALGRAAIGGLASLIATPATLASMNFSFSTDSVINFSAGVAAVCALYRFAKKLVPAQQTSTMEWQLHHHYPTTLVGLRHQSDQDPETAQFNYNKLCQEIMKVKGLKEMPSLEEALASDLKTPLKDIYLAVMEHPIHGNLIGGAMYFSSVIDGRGGKISVTECFVSPKLPPEFGTIQKNLLRRQEEPLGTELSFVDEKNTTLSR